ncbi:unnamed protein product [Dicrocoelium dendriticum]|nr:unnamed protein product [Dicrocoelium dendriticum]
MSQRERLTEVAVCNRITKFATQRIKDCKITTREVNYGIASVSIYSTNISVWEAQLQLMRDLNSQTTKYCHFNVANAVIFKGY